MFLNTHAMLAPVLPWRVPCWESPQLCEITSFQAKLCFLESWEVAETHTEMNWREADSLPDSKNLVRGHTHAYTHLIESWRYCPVTGLKPAEPFQQLSHTKSNNTLFQGSHSPYTFNFHELNYSSSGKKQKANKKYNK